MSTSTATARLELRLPPAEKSDIEEAAQLTGRSVTEYVRAAARAAAHTDLSRNVVVTPEVFDALLDALASPAPLSPAMAQAHERAAQIGI